MHRLPVAIIIIDGNRCKTRFTRILFHFRVFRLSWFSVAPPHFSILPFPLHSFYATDVNQESPIDYKSGSACSTPTKDTLKSYDRNYSGPVLPPRSTMCAAPAHHYSAPLNFRKGLAAKCSWKCTAIAVILLSIILLSALIFVAGMYGSQRCPTICI